MAAPDDGDGRVMDLSGLRDLNDRATPAPVAYTAKVIKTNAAGLWVAPLGEDIANTIGPCRGTAAVGDVVLVILTQERPWVLK